MQIIGRGFLAEHLSRIEDRHHGVVAIAAGVSCAADTAPAAFTREADLVGRVIDQCQQQKRRLLFFSTSSTGMYGNGGTGREADPVFPPTPYGKHKYALENAVRASGVDHLILRLAHVVGPHQPDHQLLPTLTRQILSGSVNLHRNAVRDLIAVDDTVTLIDLLLERGVSREIVNVATGHPVLVADLVADLERRLGVQAAHAYVEVPANQSPDISTLLALAPTAATLGFAPDYYREVLDRYPPLRRAA
jgi:NDP-hexose 4-ketoreductase